MADAEEPKVAKSKAHQDQVSRAKTERLERHSGSVLLKATGLKTCLRTDALLILSCIWAQPALANKFTQLRPAEM